MSNARSLAFGIANSVSNAHLYKNIFLTTVAGKRQKYSLPKIGLTCTTPPRSYYLESAEFIAVSRQHACFYSEKFK